MTKAGGNFLGNGGIVQDGGGGGDWHMSLPKVPEMCEW